MQRHHVTLFHAYSNRKQYKWFSLPTVVYQMQWMHLTHVFGMLLKYQSHVFWDTGRLMGPGQSHTGRMGLKDRCEGKLLGQSETTSSLALTYTICTGLFWQCQRHLRHARFLPTGQNRDLPIQLVG